MVPIGRTWAKQFLRGPRGPYRNAGPHARTVTCPDVCSSFSRLQEADH